MKINTKVRYGIRTMIEIAINWNGEGVFQREIAERQEISFKYLDHIISSLKASGLILNAEGRGSGYKLSRDPEKISVYDVYRAFENDLCVIDCLSPGGECKRDQICPTKDFWHQFNVHMIDFLSSKSIGELAKKQKELQQSEELNMFFI
ncbi:MAG TPA: Rrf2 family transcriptional regulator [Bacteroides sp.]|nr:Rrf2 family transcriptional regulator [Bacteroides sp.]